MEVCAKGALPFLGLHRSLRIGSVENKAFKIELAQTANSRARLEICVDEVAYAIVTFDEAHFRVEMRSDFAVIGKQVQPVALIVHTNA